MELRQFVIELKSRKVYRTAAVYSAGAWALLQVADVLFPVVGLPDWTVSAVLVLAAIGFPIAVVLSWIFELTPDSQARAREQVTSEDGVPVSRIIEFTLIIVLCGLVGYLYLGRLTDMEKDTAIAPGVASASIAVMPFVNLSSEKEMEYLGDGLAEEILNLLAKLTELKVAARTSSFYFKDKDADIQTISERLGVGHVLEGSVRFAGSRVRVTAQLIKSSDGFHLWSETYDRDMTDLFALQDEIAGEVVDSLQLLLSTESQDALARERSADPESYDYYLRARSYLRMPRDKSNLLFANELFEKAVAVNPKFADAYAGLCDGRLGLYEIDLEVENFRSAEAACQKALSLDRRAATVYIALGHLYRASGQFTQAIDEFKVALALGSREADAYLGLGETYFADGNNVLAEQSYQAAIDMQPNYWNAFLQMANFLLETGNVEEAVPYYTRLTELMPDSELAFNNLGVANLMLGDFEGASEAWRRSLSLSPSALTYSNMATSLFLLGRFDEAIPIYHQAVELTPSNYELWGNLGDAYRLSSEGQELALPMYGNAIKLARERIAVNPTDAETLALMGHYHACSGDRENALRLLQQALESGGESTYVNYSNATALTALGEYDRALDALEKALALGFPSHIAAADANLGGLSKLPRFEALITQMD